MDYFVILMGGDIVYCCQMIYCEGVIVKDLCKDEFWQCCGLVYQFLVNQFVDGGE